jgi:hypothetical protein
VRGLSGAPLPFGDKKESARSQSDALSVKPPDTHTVGWWLSRSRNRSEARVKKLAPLIVWVMSIAMRWKLMHRFQKKRVEQRLVRV